jgi:hypothetical protein
MWKTRIYSTAIEKKKRRVVLFLVGLFWQTRHDQIRKRRRRRRRRERKRRNRGRRCSHELAIKEAMIWLGETGEEDNGARRRKEEEEAVLLSLCAKDQSNETKMNETKKRYKEKIFFGRVM